MKISLLILDICLNVYLTLQKVMMSFSMDKVKERSLIYNLQVLAILFFCFHGILELRIQKKAKFVIDGPPKGSVRDR